MITVFYGMCGTFKYSIMTQNKNYKNSEHIFSEIKPLFDLCTNLLETGIINDLGYAAIRLRRIKNFEPKNSNLSLTIERGVSDYIHCWNTRNINMPAEITDETKIKSIIDLESEYLEDLHLGPIEKILLVMKDKDFIQNTILNEPHRKQTYGDIDNYLLCQDNYVEFTKKYNNIDKVIEINDAKEFIKKNLENK